VIGATCWLIPDGYLPLAGDSTYRGHDCLCLLNAGHVPVQVWIDLFFEDRDPVEGLPVQLAARRCRHLRLDDPGALGGFVLPRQAPYALMVRSSLPIVVQYSRLDTTQANMSFLSVMGFPVQQPGGGEVP
jgi:hypothetical protein